MKTRTTLAILALSLAAKAANGAINTVHGSVQLSGVSVQASAPWPDTVALMGLDIGGAYTLTGTIGQPDTEYSSGGDFEVLAGFWPGGPLCVVGFDDFARLADQWLQTGSGLAGDIDQDNNVDFDDLSWLADSWLCNCPAPWPLK